MTTSGTVGTACRAAPMLFASQLEREETNDFVARLTKAKARCGLCPLQLQCREDARAGGWTGISGGVLFDEGRPVKAPQKERNDKRMEQRKCAGCPEFFRTLKTSGHKLCGPCRAAAGKKLAYAELKTAREVGDSGRNTDSFRLGDARDDRGESPVTLVSGATYDDRVSGMHSAVREDGLVDVA